MTSTAVSTAERTTTGPLTVALVDDYDVVLVGLAHMFDSYADRVLIAEIDPKVVETARQHWPSLRDRRIDAYGDLTKRFRD